MLAAGLRAAHDPTLMGSETVDRVRAHTAADVNEKLDRDAERRIMYAAGQPPAALSRRLEELDREWDMERWLEANAATLAFTGTLLGLLVSRKFLAIPCFVLPFLFQHATQGWCPPVPILRRYGVRTRREIDAEKYALKALRGDFREASASNDASAAARQAWAAARS